MKHERNILLNCVILVIALCMAGMANSAPMGTAFTYQGRLTDANSPAEGLYDFRFAVYDALNGGSQQGSTIDVNDVDVEDGYFTLGLDFGAGIFTGDARWLNIGVRPGASSGGYSTLSPRQELTPTPYALYSTDADTLDTFDSSAFAASGHDHDSVYALISHIHDDRYYTETELGTSGQSVVHWSNLTSVPADLADGDDVGLTVETDPTVTASVKDGVSWGEIFAMPAGFADNVDDTGDTDWTILGNDLYSNVSGNVGIGTAGVPAAKLTVDGAFLRDGSTMYGTNSGTHINLGTSSTTGTNGQNYSYATVGGGENNVAGGDLSTVAGGQSNIASGQYAAAAGGLLNTASDTYATVSGGNENTASSESSTVSGGNLNTASGTTATVGGGYSNSASGNGATIGGGVLNEASYDYATVGGGDNNNANGLYATVAGGQDNMARLDYATVSGGYDNDANGLYSVIAGGEKNIVHGKWNTIGGGEINKAIYWYATVGGGYWNTARGTYATVSGGNQNRAGDDGATVSGGYNNIASGFEATIGGGGENKASRGFATVSGGRWNRADNWDATVSGGYENTASGTVATVSGGGSNNAGGNGSTVGGGWGNDANSLYSTVPGGSDNAANGNYSFAAGRQAKANHDGAFVWADSTNAIFASTGNDQFLIRASGGVGIGRAPTANDLELEGTASKTAAGDWLANSDERIKTDIQTVTGALETLEKVRLVSFKYSDDYRTEHPSIDERRYLNVIAQEFAEVFPDYVKSSKEKLPNGDEILQVDSYPLTVYSAAAVQELHAIVKAKDAEITSRNAEIATLKERLAALEAAVGKLVNSTDGGQL